MNPVCPKCGGESIKTNTKYGARYDHCDLWAWGKFPLSGKTVHKLRVKAHEEFDPIWKSGQLTRTQAYIHLARELGIPHKKCHMKLFGKRMLKKVIQVVKKYKEETNVQTRTKPNTTTAAS